MPPDDGLNFRALLLFDGELLYEFVPPVEYVGEDVIDAEAVRGNPSKSMNESYAPPPPNGEVGFAVANGILQNE